MVLLRRVVPAALLVFVVAAAALIVAPLLSGVPPSGPSVAEEPADADRVADREARAAADERTEVRTAALAAARSERAERAQRSRRAELARRRGLEDDIRWRSSTPVGSANAGALQDGVRLPHEGVDFVTLDPVTWKTPNPPERRWATDRTLRRTLAVLSDYREEDPDAPRVVVGDLSRPEGGPFDARHGIVGEFGPGRGTLGHVSHQNGLDVDVYYPRTDGRARGPRSLEQVSRERSQALVDGFVAAGAQLVLVGPGTGLTGPPGVVAPAERHDDHIHVRFAPST